MQKRLILLVSLLLISFPFVSASLSESIGSIQSYVDEYNSGKITASQLIVYVEYVTNKMYENSDAKVKGAFMEEQIKSAFEQTEAKPWETGRAQFEKTFDAKNFSIIFSARPYYRHDRTYWETKSADVVNYYTINYEVGPKSGANGNDLESEINSLVTDLKYLASKEDKARFDEAKLKLSSIRQKFQNVKNCDEIMKNLDMQSYEKNDPYKKEVVYFKIIENRTAENCQPNNQCQQVCEPKTNCGTCVPSCHQEQKCQDVQNCQNVTNETTGETSQSCSTVQNCTNQDICAGCENQSCVTTNECHDVCSQVQNCNKNVNGELRIEAQCSDTMQNIHINAWGEGLEPLGHLNEGGGWNCEDRINELVGIRKVFQKDINNDFAKWFFEDFLKSNDYDKILNGERGFKKVIDILIKNEEDISMNLNCVKDQSSWPAGFENIEISYKGNNTNVEVWEKEVPVEWSKIKFYTTLYKYSWVPDRELLKGLINYKLSKIGTFGPNAKEVADIRQDEGQMALINSLSEKYGGSFDVKVDLNSDDGTIITKYLKINPNVTMAFLDNSDENPDISIGIDYNTLYNFINYMVYQSEGKTIHGANWVSVEDNGGPGQFFGMVGAFSKLWKEGVTIKPRYALIKLMFNAGDIAQLIKESQGASQ